MTNDTPIHLGQNEVIIPVTLWQSHLDGLSILIHFLKGMEVAGKGQLPGSFELVMHYRAIRSALENAKKESADLIRLPVSVADNPSNREMEAKLLAGDESAREHAIAMLGSSFVDAWIEKKTPKA